MKTIFALLMISSMAHAFSSGTLTRVEGKVEVKNSSKTRPVGVGDKVMSGETIKTSAQAKALLISSEGDQIYIGPSTTLTLDKGSSNTNAKVSLLYGKMRSMFSKTSAGKRNMSVRSGTSVMGVRGTDFTVTQDEVNKATNLAVVRGEVEVKDEAKAAPPTSVKSGESIESKAGALGEKLKLDDSKLASVTELTKISKPAEGSVPADKLKTLEGLEGKAANSSLSDIKKHVPGFDAKKLGISPSNLDQINDMAAKLAGGGGLSSLMKSVPGLPGGGGYAPAAPAVPSAPKVDQLKDAGKNMLKGFGR